MEIRRASAADVDVVLDLARAFVASFELSATAFRSSFKELIASEHGIVLVAELEGVVVGYCLAFDHLTFYANGRVAWVEEIMVREDRRRSDIGRQLMAYVEQWAQRRGAKLIALATRRAAAFYKAIGYEDSAVYFRKILPDV